MLDGTAGCKNPAVPFFILNSPIAMGREKQCVAFCAFLHRERA